MQIDPGAGDHNGQWTGQQQGNMSNAAGLHNVFSSNNDSHMPTCEDRLVRMRNSSVLNCFSSSAETPCSASSCTCAPNTCNSDRISLPLSVRYTRLARLSCASS